MGVLWPFAARLTGAHASSPSLHSTQGHRTLNSKVRPGSGPPRPKRFPLFLSLSLFWLAETTKYGAEVRHSQIQGGDSCTLSFPLGAGWDDIVVECSRCAARDECQDLLSEQDVRVRLDPWFPCFFPECLRPTIGPPHFNLLSFTSPSDDHVRRLAPIHSFPIYMPCISPSFPFLTIDAFFFSVQ